MPLAFLKAITAPFDRQPVDWEKLEEALLRADLGVSMTLHILSALRKRGREVHAQTVTDVCRQEILSILSPSAPLCSSRGKPHVILIAGVNGTGKTTSTAKLAFWLKKNHHTCLLVAADTFRAAAIEQLEIWGNRMGIDVVKSHYGSDAASLCYDAWQRANKHTTEFLLCDTAGRLHTKENLMRELAKIKRTLAKNDSDAPHERLLVVDATTGSNALVQAKEFHQTIGLTGIILTKLDSSGKGGITVAIQKELGIPTRFIGTGEDLEDFSPFDREIFVNNLL